MQVQSYLCFDGRCEQAVEFYKKALGAKLEMLMRFKEAPDPPPPGMVPLGFDDKVMHTSFRIGDTVVMAADGCTDGKANFKGFSLSLAVDKAADADRVFAVPARRRRRGADAAREDLLVAALRHAHRPLRGRLDDQRGAVRGVTRKSLSSKRSQTSTRTKSILPSVLFT